MIRIPTARTIIALVCLAPAPPVLAQPLMSTPTSVTLVAAPSLPDAAITLVLHRREARPREIVLVDVGQATAVDLAAALAQLATLRARYGDVPATDLLARPTRFTPAPDFATGDGPRLDAYLQSLRTAPARTLDALGRAPALTVTLPALRVRRLSTSP